MESVAVRRRSCLLRFRERCPFRKLCRRTYGHRRLQGYSGGGAGFIWTDISAAALSPTDPPWNDVRFPTAKQPMLEPLPPLARCQSVCPPGQSDADTHMEEDWCAAENQLSQQQDTEGRADSHMELDHDVDPETGERAQG